MKKYYYVVFSQGDKFERARVMSIGVELENKNYFPIKEIMDFLVKTYDLNAVVIINWIEIVEDQYLELKNSKLQDNNEKQN